MPNELFIYDAIGEDIFTSGVTPRSVEEDLKKLDKKQRLEVRINSPGGNVFDAVSIRSQIVDWPGGVLVKVDGLAASSASYIATVSETVVMAEGAMIMVHDPWTIAVGNSEDLMKEAGALDEIAESMVGAYMAKSGKEREVIRGVMKDETWFTAEKAIDFGLANEKGSSMAKACIIPEKFGFKNCPRPTAKPVSRLLPIRRLSAQLQGVKPNPKQVTPESSARSPDELEKHLKDLIQRLNAA